MIILGIESSCDETAVAVVEDGTNVLSSVISSTKDIFSDLGGVVPEDAARRQVECILPVLHKALEQSGLSRDDIDAIAVTKGPGLMGSLLVGTTTARTLAALWKKPLIGVHHTFGHLSSTFLDTEQCTMNNEQFPTISLSVSGGHSDVWYRQTHTRGKLLGSTRDDAAGEAFDKGAAMLGLPYPGGPSISKAAESGDETAFDFPRPLHGEETYDFSFSGLKTALKYTIQECTMNNEQCPTSALAASYQFAICLHLAKSIELGLKEYPDVKEVHIVGGVSANLRLRKMLQEICGGRTLKHPSTIQYCTDNAAMIAAGGYFLVEELGEKAFEPFETSTSQHLQLH